MEKTTSLHVFLFKGSTQDILFGPFCNSTLIQSILFVQIAK